MGAHNEGGSMRRSAYAEEGYRVGMPAQPGLAAVQVAPDLWSVGQAPGISHPNVWPMDSHGGPMETDFRPASQGTFRSHPRGEITLPLNGRIILVAIRKEVSPPVYYGDAILQRMRVVMAGPDSEV